MGAAPLPLAPGLGAGPGASEGELLHQCKASITHSCAGSPKPLPVLGESELLVHEVLLQKSSRGAPRVGEASPASHSRVKGAGDEPVLDRATTRGSCLCWPRPESPGEGDRLCAPHVIFWKGRVGSKGRVGGAAEGSQLAAISAALKPVRLPGRGPGWGKLPRSRSTSSRRPLSHVSCVFAS